MQSLFQWKSFHLNIYFSPRYISFSVLVTPDSVTMANTSEVLPLYKLANYAFIVVDITSFLFHPQIKLKIRMTNWLLSYDLFHYCCFYSENNLQEDLFDQILVGKLEFPSPYWDNITDSAKVLIHFPTWNSVSDKPLERLRSVGKAEMKIQNRLLPTLPAAVPF